MSPPHCGQHLETLETASLITPFIEGEPNTGRAKARANAHPSLGSRGKLRGADRISEVNGLADGTG